MRSIKQAINLANLKKKLDDASQCYIDTCLYCYEYSVTHNNRLSDIEKKRLHDDYHTLLRQYRAYVLMRDNADNFYKLTQDKFKKLGI